MRLYIIIYIFCLFLLSACNEDFSLSKSKEEMPVIFPDYTDITIPPNIAPLNFKLEKKTDKAFLMVSWDNGKEIFKQSGGQFTFPSSKWKKILESNKGKSIHFTVYTKENGEWFSLLPFSMHISTEPIDPYITYRLIEPGYEMWNQMGIYQRNLETFRQEPVIENKMTDGNCMNCHSFPNHNPEKMLLHLRGANAGTLLMDGKSIEKLDTRTNQTISPLVYPSWHPSEKYIAFSVNQTMQSAHTNNPNRVEVYDLQSDVVIYDIEKYEIFTSPILFSKDAMESFPNFSADGRTLYYCTADTVDMPTQFNQLRYSLCSVSFDPVKRQIATRPDTLFNARSEQASIAFPRISPDGKYLLYTRSKYGGFHIWHKDADLYTINLSTGEHTALEEANSLDSEGYHCWSSNSRWIVFTSRRIDGLYSGIHIASIDPEGKASKAFIIPQKKADFYKTFDKSFNVPELTKGKIEISGYSIIQKAKEKVTKRVEFGIE